MYAPTSAGHAAQEAARAVAQETIDEKLVARAEEWLIKEAGNRREAIRLSEGFAVTAQTAGLLALHQQLRQQREYPCLGTFISALWNCRCREKIIVYPHDTTNLHWLGTYLSSHKVLIMQGTAGQYMGLGAAGPIITPESARSRTGNNAKGTIIIADTAGHFTEWHGIRLSITTTTQDIGEHFDGKLVGQGTYKRNATLKAYVDRLLVLAKDDPLTIEQEFGDGIAITAEIKRLVGGEK